jgi:hypothetical protein
MRCRNRMRGNCGASDLFCYQKIYGKKAKKGIDNEGGKE